MDFLSGIFNGGMPTESATGRSVFEPTGGGSAGVFDPFAFAGRMMGLPTSAERVGGQRAEALSALGALVQSGLPPEKAITQFLTDPRGQKWFASDPDLLGTLKQFREAVTAPVPQVHTSAPGNEPIIGTPGKVERLPPTPMTPAQMRADPSKIYSNLPPGTVVWNNAEGRPVYQAPHAPTNQAPGARVVDPNTGRPIGPNNPTEAVQTFVGFGDLSGAPAARLRELAEMQATPENQRPDKTERAVNGLISQGVISRQLGNWMLSNPQAFKVMERKNDFGEGIGQYDIVNAVTGEVMQVDRASPFHPGGPAIPQQQGSAPPSGSGMNRFEPPRGAPMGGQPFATANSAVPYQPGFEGPQQQPVRQPVAGRDTMALGAGFNSASLSIVSSLMGTINPAFQTEGTRVNDQRQQAIEFLKTAIAGVPQATGGTLGVPKMIIEQWNKVAPDTSLFSGPPGQAVQKLLSLHDQVLNERNTMQEIATNKAESQKVRVDARQAAIALDRVLRAIPPRGVLEEMDNNIRNGTAGAPTAWETVKNTYGMMFDASMGRPPQDSPAPRAQPRADVSPATIRGMNEAQLRGLDPNTLSTEARNAYKERAQALRGGAKQPGPAQPSNRSNFAPEEAAPSSGDVSDFTRDPAGVATRNIRSSGQIGLNIEQRLQASFDMIDRAITSGQVSEGIPLMGRNGRITPIPSDVRKQRRR